VGALAAAVMAAVDARRRPLGASVAYALVIFVVLGWRLGHAPAFAPMAPGAGPTLIGLALLLVAAGAGGLGGRALVRALAAERDETIALMASGRGA
jgi:hypothetical protein